MASFTPVILPDEGEAASVWRNEKLRDFEQRMKCLGLQNDPLFFELHSKIENNTIALESLWQRQQQPEYHRKWWQDGEYDATRADEYNDRGVDHVACQDYAAAFQSFSEAIRLCPTSAVYHSNRSAVALKLRKPDVAAEDAENALERDPSYVRAALRAGQARLQLRQPEQAECHFQTVLRLQPSMPAALKGLAEVAYVIRSQEDEEKANRAYAAAGTRPPLPLTAVPEDAAALQLYNAEQMLAANPALEAVKCALVEGLILCRRYGDALAACDRLLPGLEKYYLEAEALWRGGDVSAAVKKLEAAGEIARSSSKCIRLKTHLLKLEDSLNSIEAGMVEGLYSHVMETCAEVLSYVDAGACSGLLCHLLCRRADAAAHRRQWEDAVADLDRAVDLDPCADAPLRLRADVNKQMGAYVEYFLDVQRLKRVAPGSVGLASLLEDAARLCLEHGAGGGDPPCGRVLCAIGPASAFKALEVRYGATAAEVRRAYLRLAAEWHPDKWATASDNARSTAEERFKVIQSAYERLCTVSHRL